MPITAELHDGTRLEFPEGTDPAVIQRTVKSVLAAKQTQQPSMAEQAGAALRDVPRQVGLTARYAMEGLPGIVDVLASPFRIAQEKITGKPVPTAGGEGGMLSKAADYIGLPKPETANERVVGDITRGGFSAVAPAAGASRLVPMFEKGAATRNVLEQMAARPGVQVAGGASAGGAGGAVREAGGGPVEQFLASLAGGVVGGSAAAKIPGAVESVASRLTPQTVQLRNADQQIQLTLQRAGIDWSQVPERVRQGMRGEVAAALNTGQPLNPDALRRLLVFRSTGTTPTVGMLTQDPGQITREMNLAKTGANSMDLGLQRLPAIQNQNAAALLRQLDDAGAANAPSAFAAGERAIGGLQGTRAAAESNINRLYSAARDTQGRSLPLEGGTFTARANQLLDEANVGSFLPPDIANKMNAIATGKYPLTVDVAEQLKTSIGNLQRGSADGNVRRALGLVRQALDDAPLQGAQRVNPGNLPAAPGTVPPSPVAAGQESIGAFNAARSANRAWMQRVEGNPALRAVVEGVEPDQFVQRFVIGKGASAADVQALRRELDPQAFEGLRQYLVRYLRDAATNSTDDITKFSNTGYRAALRSIGDEKLGVFFSGEELQHLRNVGEAAKYMQAQPVGSAVNNSNSGALVLGRGLDMLENVSRYVPLGGRDILQGWIQGAQQRQVLAPRNALVQAADPGAQVPRPNPLLAAAIASPVQASEDDRGDRRSKRDRVDSRGR
jgi:hypothetical protein